MDIDFHSTDGAITSIAEATENDGEHQWSVPLALDLARGYDLHISDSADPTVTGRSQDLTLGGMIGFQWNGTAEEVLVVSPERDEHRVLGTVGDLMWWSSQVVVDYGAEKLYVFGSNGNSESKLYTMDMWTMGLQSDQPFSSSAQGWQVNSAGQLVGCRWNGAEEEMVSVDPATGSETVLGTVGDLQYWSAQTAIDNTQNRLYVVGTDSAGQGQLWVMDSLTGALLDTIALSTSSLSGLQLSPDGNGLLYGRWNGSEEELVSVDVVTGQETTLGVIGDLMWWSGQTVINPENNTMLAWGSNSLLDNMYVMDLSTGVLVDTIVVQQAVQAPRFVY